MVNIDVFLNRSCGCKMSEFTLRVIVISIVISLVYVQSVTNISTSYFKNGSIIIGGLFPLHYEAERPDNYRFVCVSNVFCDILPLF